MYNSTTIAACVHVYGVEGWSQFHLFFPMAPTPLLARTTVAQRAFLFIFDTRSTYTCVGSQHEINV